jgi:hypothetical protein
VLGLLIRCQRYLSFSTLVLHPLLATLAILAGTACLVLKTGVPGTTMAAFTLPSLFLMGGCTALLQGGTLSLACMMSPAHIQVGPCLWPCLRPCHSRVHAPERPRRWQPHSQARAPAGGAARLLAPPRPAN